MIIKDKHTGFKAVPSAYVLFIKGNKILLLKRKNTGFMDGFYGFPAGHLDGGETAGVAAIREVKEEVGVDIKKSDLEFVHVMHRVDSVYTHIGDKNTLHERIDFFYIAKKWQGEIRNMEPNKCEKLVWHNMNNLPDKVIPYIKSVIEAYRDKIYYSEVGWTEK